MTKVIGNTAATPMAIPDLKQTNPRKADYIKGKELIDEKIETAINDIAIHSSASGEVIRVDDVCPLEHTVKAKISGENIEPTNVTVTRCGKNILGFAENFSVTVNGLTVSYDKATQIFTLNGTPTASGPIVFSNKMTHRPMLKTGTRYTLSLEYISGDCSIGENNVFYIGADNTPDGNRNNWTNVGFVSSGKIERSSAINYNYLTGCWVYIGNNTNASYTNYKFRVQLEKGEVATDYELHKCETHTPNADGTLEFKSVAPTMTFLTDTVGANIDVEYNQDINSVVGDYIKSPETAQIGQALVVKEIDDKGKPITWETANVSGGGGGTTELGYPITPQIDITVEEAVRSMSITTINGVPLKDYNFTAFRVYAVNSIQAEKVNSEFIVNIDKYGKIPYLSAGTGFMCATNQQYWGGGIDLKNAYAWNMQNGTTNPTWRLNVQSSSNATDLIKLEQFDEIVIKGASADIPVGTRIQIWFK